MAGSFSDYQVHKWLSEVTPCFIALHFDSPLAGGAYASEFQGDGYARASAAFTTPANRTCWNLLPLRFMGLSAGLVTWVGGWDAQTQGNLLWADQLSTPVRILAGGGYAISAGDLALSFG